MGFLDDAYEEERQWRALLMPEASFGAEIAPLPTDGGLESATPDVLPAAQALSAALPVGASKNAAVLAFQTAYNAQNPAIPLTEDGLWGPKTSAALKTTLGAPSSPPAPAAPAAPLGRSTPVTVGNVRDLAASLHATPPHDGIFHLGVKQFQVAYNASGATPTLDADGIWGPMTAAAVNQVLGLPGAAPSASQAMALHNPPEAPTLPAGAPSDTDYRPYIVVGTVIAAGALLWWAPWKHRERAPKTLRYGREPKTVRY